MIAYKYNCRNHTISMIVNIPHYKDTYYCKNLCFKNVFPRFQICLLMYLEFQQTKMVTKLTLVCLYKNHN